MQFSLLDLYELHPPPLITVATLACETQNPENVTLQRDITKENCIASSKWTRVIMCLKFTYMGVTHRRPAKTLDEIFF